MKEYLERLVIDEDQNYALAKYSRDKGVRKVTKSDHNIMFCQFSVRYSPQTRKIRREIFKLRDKEGQESFLQATSEDGSLSSVFSLNNTFPHNAQLFYRKLTGQIHKCFKKVRIVKGGSYRHKFTRKQLLIDKIQELRVFMTHCKCPDKLANIRSDLHIVEAQLIDETANENARKVHDYVHNVETSEGKFSQLNLWKLKKKLCPRPEEQPMAKRNSEGTLITSPHLLKQLYLQTYTHRLRNREMKKELTETYLLKMELWTSRLTELMQNKSEDWNIEQLRKALRSLKSNKTIDPNNMINEIFKKGCIGKDLEKALLILFNQVKANLHLPNFLIKQNITSIFKNKGSRLDLKNDRGIFILTSLRKILDKLLYFDMTNMLK